ncbi:ABC transporter permease [Paenibacillus albiflavus]|uniref:ABC transporter permease n=1 Tax=Paenibacillus albiflavus TaxID=2545760 RepID=UPI00140439ED|nr:ABC transporter permease [Paenibacillus albiflavus]
MLSLIHTEMLKLKRKRMLWVMFGIAAAMPALITFYASGISRENSLMDSFMDFYKMSLGYMNILILPCMLGILGTMIFTDEYKNDTMKQLAVVPVTKIELLISKIAMLFILSTTIMLFTGVLNVIGGFIAGGFSDINGTLILRVFSLCLISGLLTPLALMPVVLVIVISKKGYILPISLNVVYVFLGYIAASSLVGIHPISSLMKIVWHNNKEGVLLDGSLPMSMINIAAIALVCFATSALFLKRRLD